MMCPRELQMNLAIPAGCASLFRYREPTARRDALPRRTWGVRNEMARLWIPGDADGSCMRERVGPGRDKFEMARGGLQAAVSIGQHSIDMTLARSELTLRSAEADETPSPFSHVLTKAVWHRDSAGRNPEKERHRHMVFREE